MKKCFLLGDELYVLVDFRHLQNQGHHVNPLRRSILQVQNSAHSGHDFAGDASSLWDVRITMKTVGLRPPGLALIWR